MYNTINYISYNYFLNLKIEKINDNFINNKFLKYFINI